jgi:uncharacterized protein YerC
MTQVSRRILSQKVQERIFHLFTNALVKCDSRGSAASFIEDMLTPTEQVMLSKRFSIAFMLLEGYDYETIKRMLKVSTATIGRVASWFKIKGEEVRRIINRIKRDESMKKAVEEIMDSILEIIGTAPGQDWKSTRKMLWHSKKLREKPY